MTGTRRRIRRSRDEWQHLINEQAESGQTQAAFCAARGISVGSLRNWKRRLGAGSSPAPWIELGTLAEAKAATWDIELELGDGTIFGQNEVVRIREVLDGTSKTLTVVKVRLDLAKPWTAPRPAPASAMPPSMLAKAMSSRASRSSPSR